MITNNAGLALIKEFEGCALRAYRDGAGVWTCGYGHTSNVSESTTCDSDLANKWFKDDLEITENVVAHEIQVPLSSDQFSALVVFTFNEGAGHLGGSTVRRLLNEGDFYGAADAILMWDKIRGVISPGLDRRRASERQLFLRGTPPRTNA